MDYTLIRSKRKTVAIYIRNGTVEVRAPIKMPKAQIEAFVASKEKWIKTKLVESGERAKLRAHFELNYGDEILYRGKNYPIVAKEGGRAGFDHGCFQLPPNLTPEQIKSACIQIYRLLAKRDLTEKVFDFAQQMSVTPVNVKINGAKTRWGSCSAKKSLNFSWRLIMAEDEVVDYVVVHELAHIIEMNHSRRFWQVVESVLPDYGARQERLKMLQRRLSVENWD